jgi:aspartyl-tRNA(Asn)/glutamyl-tRNA(Gln) amidotransferase subunit B
MQPVSVLSKYPLYEVVIGMEVHVQLATKTKIFCTCANEVIKDANRNICQTCTGQPGSLPVLNKQVVEYAVLAGLALNCNISKISIFDRKHYFYPDLPKNYQITQQYQPICLNGHVPIRLEDGTTKKVRLNRIHIEEDAGKNIHSTTSNESFVNLNRAGTPLLEIVSEPDLASAEEVKAYLRELRSTVQYLNICSGNMEDGAFRADTNISVRKKGDPNYGTKCELKNINSFKFIGDAIEYEIERQIELLEEGGRVRQETRLWDTKSKCTTIMRSKEEAADYRFFQDPDLPLIEVDDAFIEAVRGQLPELPYQKLERLVTKMGLTHNEAEILVEDIELGRYYNQAAQLSSSKQIINWILRDLLGYLKENKISLAECKVTPAALAAIVDLTETGKINNHAAKEVFEAVAQTGAEPQDVVKQKGLEQIGSIEELEAIVTKILDENQANVAAYKAGTTKLFGFFVGEAMKRTQGKGNPKILQELLKKLLS